MKQGDHRRGRKTKLTKEVQEVFIAKFRRVGTLTGACHAAGITRVTAFNWLRRGTWEKSGQYREFLNAFVANLADLPHEVLSARTRHIRRAYERKLNHTELSALVYREVSRIFEEGRVSDRDALAVIEMICQDFDEKVENLSLSWAETQVPWRGE